jgi:hypothetical protein
MGYTQAIKNEQGRITGYKYVSGSKVKVKGTTKIEGETKQVGSNIIFVPKQETASSEFNPTKEESTEQRNERYLSELNRAYSTGKPEETLKAKENIMRENPQTVINEVNINRAEAEGRIKVINRSPIINTSENKNITGTITQREKGNWFEEIQRSLTITARSDSGEGWSKDFSGTLKSGVASTALIATQTGKTIVYDIPVSMFQMVTHPIRTAKETYNIITHPTETISGIAEYSRQNPELAIGTGIGIGLSGKVYGYGKKKFLDPIIAETKTSILPNYNPIEEVGVEFRAAHTVESPTSSLYKLENKPITAVHVTIADLPNEFVTTANPSGAGEFRSSNKLFHFYKSAPYENKPQGYLGYAGILDDVDSVPVEYVETWTKPKIKALVFENEKVTQTPVNLRGQDIKVINMWQGKQSGATLVPSENIKGFSSETQVISPSRYVDTSGEIMVGYEDFKGSIIKKEGASSYTYYIQDIKNPYQNIIAKQAWDILGVKKEYYKIELIPASTSPVTSAADIEKVSLLSGEGSTLTIGENYYKPKRYETVSPTSPITTLKEPEIVKPLNLVSNPKTNPKTSTIISSSVSGIRVVNPFSFKPTSTTKVSSVVSPIKTPLSSSTISLGSSG